MAGRIGPVLTETEVEAVVMATVNGCDPRPVGDAQLQAALRWATGAKLEATMLELVLQGRVDLQVTEAGEVLFQEARHEAQRGAGAERAA